jgi:Protein of unknown function (DUF2630)
MCMDDKEILHRITTLVDEEHSLRGKVQRGEVSSDEERRRLGDLEVALDQCWDLLRRRRADRANGTNPDSEQARSASEVEGYLQ